MCLKCWSTLMRLCSNIISLHTHSCKNMKSRHYCDLNIIKNSNSPQLVSNEGTASHGCKAIFTWTSIHHQKVCKDRNKYA
jgi:hypothetical protein